MGLLDDLEFLKKRKPNVLADVRQLQGPSEPYLRQQYPEVYGGLGGLLGMTPDAVVRALLKLPYDQIIREFDAWTHISIADKPRRQALIIDKAGIRAFV